MKNIVIFVMIAFLMGGCSDTPVCSDSDVKDLVLNIAKQEKIKYLKYNINSIIHTGLETENKIDKQNKLKLDKFKSDKFILDKARLKNKSKSYIDYYTNPTFRAKSEAFERQKQESERQKRDDERQKQIHEYQKQIDEFSSNLIAIRANSIDEKIKKSTCKAQIQFRYGETKDIEYTAQKTDEKLYVEVYGL